VFDPLFLHVWDVGIAGAGVAIVCAESATVLAMSVLFAIGKFDTKTKLSNLWCCFSKDTFVCIRAGVIEFFLHSAEAVPSIVGQKFFAEDANAAMRLEDYLAAFNTVFKLWELAQSFANAVGTALLAAASFAVGANRPRRVLQLFGWASVIAGAASAVIEAMLLLFAPTIARLFTDTAEVVDPTIDMIRIVYSAHFVSGQAAVTASFLQAVGSFWTSLILVITMQGIVPATMGTALYWTDPHGDVYRLLRMHPYGDVVSVILGVIFAIRPLMKLRREAHDQEMHDGPEFDVDQGEIEATSPHT
jgi:Na+-driven multidrug efflux pump